MKTGDCGEKLGIDKPAERQRASTSAVSGSLLLICRNYSLSSLSLQCSCCAQRLTRRFLLSCYSPNALLLNLMVIIPSDNLPPQKSSSLATFPSACNFRRRNLMKDFMLVLFRYVPLAAPQEYRSTKRNDYASFFNRCI